MTSEEKRIKFHNKLKEVLGSNNVYFNPPRSTDIKYPCIIYNLKDIPIKRASNEIYILEHVYNVLLIGIKPYEDIKDKILISFKYSKFDRPYINEGLYHYAYTIYE